MCTVQVSEKHKRILRAEECPYCGGGTVLIDSKVIYGRSYGLVWACAKGCDAYVGVHKGTKKPLGRLANKELRKAKSDAHKYFDKLWKSKAMKRKEAYKWLADNLGIPTEYTHIGMFNVDTCNKVIQICKEQFLTLTKDNNGNSNYTHLSTYPC